MPGAYWSKLFYFADAMKTSEVMPQLVTLVWASTSQKSARKYSRSSMGWHPPTMRACKHHSRYQPRQTACNKADVPNVTRTRQSFPPGIGRR